MSRKFGGSAPLVPGVGHLNRALTAAAAGDETCSPRRTVRETIGTIAILEQSQVKGDIWRRWTMSALATGARPCPSPRPAPSAAPTRCWCRAA